MNNEQFNANQINGGNLNNQQSVNEEKEQNKKSNFNLGRVLLLVLLIILIALFIYIIYLKVTDVSSNKPNDGDNNKVVDDSKNKYTASNFNEYLDMLNILSNKTNLIEITNQEILQVLLVEYLRDENHNKESFTIQDLEEIHRNSIFSNLGVEYTSILDRKDLYGFTLGDVLYELNEDNYKLVMAGGHGLNEISIPVYRELILFNETDGRYTISQRIVFANSYGDGPNPYYLYYDSKQAIEDSNNTGENSFIKLDETNLSSYLDDDSSINFLAVEKYIMDNYDDIKDKLSTYTYTFEEIDNHLVLTNFRVTPMAS